MKKIIAAVLCMLLVMTAGAFAENLACEPAYEESAVTMTVGDTMEMMLEEAQTENSEIVWTSSDETVATVDENGVVAALNAGEATVTAAITTTTIETVEKTVTETVETTNEAGEVVSEDVEKTVTEDVEKTETTEVEVQIVVEPVNCPGCDAEYTSAEEYQAHVQPAVCGAEGHYVCDGRDHETVLDEFCANENPHRVCQAGEATHVCDSCGETYACEDSGSHTICRACGNHWCYKDEGNHVTPACGKIEHRPCVSENYHKSEHYRCKYCNQRLCNGRKHGLGKCVAAVETPAE